MRAAGVTLTLDEFAVEAKAVDGLTNVAITLTSGRPLVGVEAGVGGIVLDDEETPDEDSDLADSLLDFVQNVASGEIKSTKAKAAALDLLASLGLGV